MKHKLFRRADVWIFLAILALSGLLFLLSQTESKGALATVRYRGEVIDTVDLRFGKAEERTYTVRGGEVCVLFSQEGAEILSSPCERKSCVRTGKITKAGDAILCLPLGFSVTLSGENALDGVTG